MTQAPRSLIVQSEAIQRKSWRMLSSVAPPSLCDALGIRAKVSGSTLYQGALKVPGAQFSKIFSFGLDGPTSSEAMESAEEWLREHCPKNSLMMVPPNEWNNELESMILNHGFQRYPLDITIFHMDADAAPESTRSSEIDVRPVSSEGAESFGRVLAEGLGCSVAELWLGAYAIGQPGLTAYLAYHGSTPVGAAALLVDGDWGWLFIAAVRPTFRNRGAQTALLARRIADGKKAGVRTFNIGALRPAPGHTDVFASYRNIERFGFKTAYHRKNYVLSD